MIVSSNKIVEDLLVKRGAIYSDRGKLYMIHMVTGGGDLLANGLNDYWRRGRKFADRMLTSNMAAQWEPWQAKEAIRLVTDIVADPDKYGYWFERFATSVSLRQGFGRILNSSDEEAYHTRMIVDRMHNIERIATPGAYLVEIIPALMYLPEFLAPFKQEAKALYETESNYFRSLLEGSLPKL